MTKKQKQLTQLPQVNSLLQHPEIQAILAKFKHEFVVECVQQQIELKRQEVLSNEKIVKQSRLELLQEIVSRVTEDVEKRTSPSLRKVINGTGVILHTGLGRAPLHPAVAENLAKIAEGYCNIELDLATGKRGDRLSHVEYLLCHLTGAEAACVVNNNAAAVLLVLNTLGFGKETIVSRGQLVEIGGSFRMPDIMEKSGTLMVEVGTTNKTHLKDYQKAIKEKTGLMCVVHTSNFRVKGFTNEVKLKEIVELAHKKSLPVMQDIGGGVLFDLRELGLPYEPVVRESIDAGVDIVTFSGDKVMGGPQSGIVVGKKEHINRIKSNPLMRVLRCDKLVFAALEATLQQYVAAAKPVQQNPVLKLLLEPLSLLAERGNAIGASINPIINKEFRVEVVDTTAEIGSGAMPLEKIASKAISLHTQKLSVDKLAKLFRLNNPPIIGYIRDEYLLFDLRTISPNEDKDLTSAIKKVCHIA